jgi:glycosyltransferase involved in cell wall biosynthesis
MRISVLIPVYNEEDNIQPLYDELCAVADQHSYDIEFVYVDDGSRDRSWERLCALAEKDPRMRLVRFRRNFGQTAGLAAAIDHATGDVLIPMDADLQNDPADIPLLLARLDEGYDVVSGWRKARQDVFLSRRLPSMIANRLISWWTGVFLHDYGCSLKAYRAEFLREVRLYGEMHRFVPIYARWAGARVTEIPVNHRARQFGVSKYGINRTFKVLLDMLTVKFLGDYSTKPIYLFGGGGAALMSSAVLLAVLMVGLKAWEVWAQVADPYQHKMTLLLLASFLATCGLLMVMMGLLAEIIVRTWHESQNKPIYLVRDRRNIDARLEA